MRYVGTRNPRAEHNPLRSIPLFQPASRVIGPTAQEKAENALWIARRDLPNMEAFYERARAALGRANRFKRVGRRFAQAQAMRLLNWARRDLRRVRKALAAAELAMLAFVPAA